MTEQVLEQMSNIINNLDESQLKVEKHAFDVINSSDTSLNLVKESIGNVEEIIKGVNDLNSIIEISAEDIKRLEKMSELIQQFANVISKIATKTNILSLNASIEAARAGEMGKGFAVVAKEVGALASQSTKSSNDISETVKDVNSFVDGMVKSMNEIYEKSVKQHDMAAQISELLQKVLEAAHVANDESRGMEHEIAYQRDITDKAKETLAQAQQ